jgi:hypothetical protein
MNKQRKASEPTNDLAAFSDMLNRQFEEDKAKREYSRSLYEKLDFNVSDKADHVFELVQEIQRLQRDLMGTNRAINNVSADIFAMRLPIALQELEDMLK